MNNLNKDCTESVVESTQDRTYKLRFEIDRLVRDNFGYSPQSSYFDRTLEQMREAEKELKAQDYAAWEMYMETFYGGNR